MAIIVTYLLLFMMVTFRLMPKKVTNSEKTVTKKNLSQHKYLLYKRKLQLETQAALKSDNNLYQVKSFETKHAQTQQPAQHSRIPVAVNRNGGERLQQQSNGSVSNTKDIHHHRSDSETGWYSHLPNHNKWCDTSASCVNHSYLRKLLTSIKLAPKIVGKHAGSHSPGENSHTQSPNDNSSALDCASEDILPVNPSKSPYLVPMTLEHSETGTGDCQSMAFSDACVPTVNMPSSSQAKGLQQHPRAPHPKISTCTVFSFQPTTSIKPRRQTKSAPSVSLYRLQPSGDTYQNFGAKSPRNCSRSKSVTRSYAMNK